LADRARLIRGAASAVPLPGCQSESAPKGHELQVIGLDLAALAGVSGEQHSFDYISFAANFVTTF